MRRLVDLWWVTGSALLMAVIVLTAVLYVGESDRDQQKQHAARRQVVTALRESVADVLTRERALARVVGTVPGSVASRWAVLSDIVMTQPLANSTSFIEPVAQQDRRAFQHRTGIRLYESPEPGVSRVAASRPLHMVITALRQRTSTPPVGLDLAANPLRRSLLLQAARTGGQVATPPIEFLDRKVPTHGVAVFVAVRDQRGRLKGWVGTAYEAQQLAAMVTARMPGTHLTIRDGATPLVGSLGPRAGAAAIIAVAGRRWSVWAEVPASPPPVVPWLVLSLGLTLAAAVTLVLRQTAAGARRSTHQLALLDAEQAALSRIATLVAEGETPAVVFTSVAEQIGMLLHSGTGAVSRFDPANNRGVVLGGWTRDGQDLAQSVYALDGVSASAAVFRTGRPARTASGYRSGTDPIAPTMMRLGGTDGIAAPITVGGRLWGALGAAYGEEVVPAGVELRLERFASLVGLAVSNAEAWDMLAREASTDSLTGIANRRLFRERLSAEIARAHRYGRHLSLVLMDLDHFKTINDVHGHPAGDRVLVRFAQLLGEHSREGELVARIGGEEFAWLIPETDQHGACVAAERLRRAIESVPIDAVRKVTVSAGVACTEDAPDADGLIGDADRALYRAKERGRNMTVIYSDGPGAQRAPSLGNRRRRSGHPGGADGDHREDGEVADRLRLDAPRERVGTPGPRVDQMLSTSHEAADAVN